MALLRFEVILCTRSSESGPEGPMMVAFFGAGMDTG